jgi:charged multivesicular body protein 3
MALDSLRDFLFGKPLTPEESVKKWRTELRKEMRSLDRSVMHIEREEFKVKTQIKQLAKRQDMSGVKLLAKELVRSKKAKERLHMSKAQLNSVQLHLQHNLAQYKLAGCIKSSAEVMASMNNAIRLPEIHQAMVMMATEMQKAGLIEEMVDDLMENDEIEDEADEEIDKVLTELNLHTVAALPSAAGAKSLVQEEPEPEVVEEDIETIAMQQRLNALKGV